MSLRGEDVALVACPRCRGPLDAKAETEESTLERGSLRCEACGTWWPIIDGIPNLVDAEAVNGLDWWLRPIYDFVAPAHDLGVVTALPLMQFPDPGASRERYLERLELGRLEPHADGSPVRILEVGVGSGANLPLLRPYLPIDLDVELWGLDLSSGMLRECRLRADWIYPLLGVPRVVLFQGDAHDLPFFDGVFDRVFHVGGINGYRDVERGLAEMARVARPGTPIVVVDEELDPGRTHWPHHVLSFRLLTAFDPDPRAPRDLVPADATRVEVIPVSRFYYCLTFETPSPGTEANRGRDDGRPAMDVREILTEYELEELRKQYDALEMGETIGTVLPEIYPPIAAYMSAVGQTLYPEFQKGGGKDSPLSAANRERCLVTLLAARRGEGVNLAVHIYLALVNGVCPAEIARILVLAGIYSGISAFPPGVTVEARTLATLKAVVGKGDARPAQVYDALKKAFA